MNLKAHLDGKRGFRHSKENLPSLQGEALFLTKKRPSRMEKSVSLNSEIREVICLVSITCYANITCDRLTCYQCVQ